MDELVSVIIPVYKVENYLQRCIDSILNQTYTNIEIILVDDGSPDNCAVICDHNSMLDSRIIVIHKENGGLSAARNAGMEKMNGSYVTFVDSDDFLQPYAIETWITEIVTYKADMVVGNFQDYYNEDDTVERSQADVNIFSGAQMMRKMLVENDRLCVAWGKLYRREMFDLLRYPEDITFAEDMFVIYRLFDLADRIVYDNDKYYYYNQQGESLVRSKFSLKKLKRVEAIEEWLDFVDKKYPYLHDEAFGCFTTNVITACTQLLLYDHAEKDTYLNKYLSIISESYPQMKTNSYISGRNKRKALLLNQRALLLYKFMVKFLTRG